MTSDQPPEFGSSALLAWGVHLLTASGAVLALLALDAVERGSFREALLWLFAALLIDGVDGTLARAVRVQERLPRIDGAALDLVIDYLNYVLVPTLIVLRAGLLPESLAVSLCASVLVSSLYVFARRDMKTDDGYFRGFPALWNVVAAYFVLLAPDPWLAATIMAALVVLTFAPVHVVHPFRCRNARIVAPLLAAVWAGATTCLLLFELAPLPRQVALGCSLASLFGLALIGARRTLRGDPRATR